MSPIRPEPLRPIVHEQGPRDVNLAPETHPLAAPPPPSPMPSIGRESVDSFRSLADSPTHSGSDRQSVDSFHSLANSPTPDGGIDTSSSRADSASPDPDDWEVVSWQDRASTLPSNSKLRSASPSPDQHELDADGTYVHITHEDARSGSVSPSESFFSVSADDIPKHLSREHLQELIESNTPQNAVAVILDEARGLVPPASELEQKVHENTPSASALDRAENGSSRSENVATLHNEILGAATLVDVATHNLYLDKDGNFQLLHDKAMTEDGPQDLKEKAENYDAEYKAKMGEISKHLIGGQGEGGIENSLRKLTGEKQSIERQQEALHAMQQEVKTKKEQKTGELDSLLASQDFQTSKKGWDGAVANLQDFYQSRAFVPEDLRITIDALDQSIAELHVQQEKVLATKEGMASAEKLESIAKLVSSLKEPTTELDKRKLSDELALLQNSLTPADKQLQSLVKQSAQKQEELAANFHLADLRKPVGAADISLPHINEVLDQIANSGRLSPEPEAGQESHQVYDAKVMDLGKEVQVAKEELGETIIAGSVTASDPLLGERVLGNITTNAAYQINGLSAHELGRSLSDKLAYEVGTFSNGIKDATLFKTLESRKTQLDNVVDRLELLYQAMPTGENKEAIAADLRTQSHERDLLGNLLSKQIGHTETDRKIRDAQAEIKKMETLDSTITKRLKPLEEQGKTTQKKLNQNGFQDLRWNMQANNLRTTELAKAEKVYTSEKIRLEAALEKKPGNKVNQQDLVSVKAKLETISEEQAKLDAGYRALLLKMQDFDKKAQQNEGYLGEEKTWSALLSSQSWTDWTKQNISGFGMGSEDRRPTISEFVLRRNLAKNGLESMGEAYGKLMGSFKDAGIEIGKDGGMSTITDTLRDPKKLLSGLGAIHDWMRDNPREAEMLGGNLQHAYEILKKGGAALPQQIQDMVSTAWNTGSTRNMIKDALSGKREAIAGIKDFKTMPPEMIALLDLAGYAPYVAGAAKGAGGESLGGNLGKAIANSLPGGPLVAYTAGAIGGLLQTKAEQKMSDAVAQNRDLEVGVNAVLKGLATEGSIQDKLKDVGKSVLERQLLQDAGTVGTDLHEGGIKNAIKRYGEGLKEWWNKSTVGEKLYRGLTQIGIPLAAAGAAIAAIVATGGLALPVMITVAVLGGLGASAVSSYAAKRFNDLLAQIPGLNKIPPFSSMKASQTAVDNKIYVNRMQDAMNNVAKELDKSLGKDSLTTSEAFKLLQEKLPEGNATQIAHESIANLQSKIGNISEADFMKALTDKGLSLKKVTPKIQREIVSQLLEEKVGTSLDQTKTERQNRLAQEALQTDDGQQFAKRATENPTLLKKEDGTSFANAEAFMRAQIEAVDNELMLRKPAGT